MDYTIKWSDTLKGKLTNGEKLKFKRSYIVKQAHRPFVIQWYYSDKSLSDRLTSNHYEMFGKDLSMPNKIIAINVGNKTFNVLASKYPLDLHFNGDSQCFPLYRYDRGGQFDNITEWSLGEFKKHYNDAAINKEDIFHYVYAILHAPQYRSKYAQSLKKKLLYVPFYDVFFEWASIGKKLMDLHCNFEDSPPYSLERIDNNSTNNCRVILRVLKEEGTIEIDADTMLKGIPAIAWEYWLGNMSALEWVLESHKERKPSDPTIRDKFNAYRFANYKEQVIDLLYRVCTVSVETMKIIEQMPHN